MSPVAEQAVHFVFAFYIGFGISSGLVVARINQPKFPLPPHAMFSFFVVWSLLWLPIWAKMRADQAIARKQRRDA